MNLADKYDSRTAALYRDKVSRYCDTTQYCSIITPSHTFLQISSLAEGRSWNIETSPARHHKVAKRKTDTITGVGHSSSSSDAAMLTK